jgi:hypothetical protein
MLSAENSRRQLTLFVPEPERTGLDSLRQRIDPIQAELIPAHVTLCREDEIEQLPFAHLAERIRSWSGGAIRLGFGPPERFAGHGALLPCTRGHSAFRSLRAWLLAPAAPRAHAAHITLAHPRNPRSIGNTDEALEWRMGDIALSFSSVALIEQSGTAPWRILEQTPFSAYALRSA